MTRAKQISQYLAMGFELIPLKPDGSKGPIPGITWAGQVKYHKKPIAPAGVRELLLERPACNIGIITGSRSRIFVIDFDTLGEESRILGELGLPADTTTVKTRRGLHFYYRIEPHQAIKKQELSGSDGKDHGHVLGDGQYIVAPPSIHHTGHVYAFLGGKDLNALKDVGKILPARLITAPPGPGTPGSGQPVRLVRPFRVKSYAITRGLGCVQQILDRPLVVGERHNSLWLLYNLMISNGDISSYAQGVIMKKNALLSNPLPEQDLRKHIFSGRIYRHTCLRVRETAPFISCDRCNFRNRQGGQMVSGWASDRVLLSNRYSGVEHALWYGINTREFDIDTPRDQIAKRLGVSRITVTRGIAKLRRDGLIESKLPGIK